MNLENIQRSDHPKAAESGVGGIHGSVPASKRLKIVEQNDPDESSKEQNSTTAAVSSSGRPNLQALVGCQFYRCWLDQHGQIQEVYGTITEYTPTMNGEIQYQVNYDVSLRAKMNAELAKDTEDVLVKLALPQHELLDMAHAWGGCWLYLEKHDDDDSIGGNNKGSDPKSITLSRQRAVLATHSPPRSKLFLWRVPDAIEPLSSSNGESTCNRVPHLTMTFRGFRLTFRVKPSSLDSQHAGFGVFLSCQPLDRNATTSNEFFQLLTGELLDMGIYAPFLAKDVKTVETFNEKCARLSSSQCLEFAFFNHSGDTVFDITNEQGMLHTLAKQHIAPYVNEVTNPYQDEQSVYTAHDPQGALHYLLGNRHLADGDFSFPADGVEREIFTDYGVMYEPVRLQKGYSLTTQAD